MDMPFAQAKLYLSKITTSNCSTLKYENCKPEHAEKDSHCHAQQEHGCLQ